METHNAFAGQGAVLLDIGGDIGALIVDMPPAMDGIEIEIKPVGAARPAAPVHSHEHPHDHGHEHEPDHVHPHVAVVARPTANGSRPTAVFGELEAGDYELYEKLGGPVRLTVTVNGGEVTEARWPD